jgi:hypothetical protein
MTRMVGDPHKIIERNDILMMKLGKVTQQSALLDQGLEVAFCALVGSKYAVIIASSQNSDWLNRHCVGLVNAHRELSEDQRTALMAALKQCSKAAAQRNELVHAIFAAGSDTNYLRVKGGRATHTVTVALEPLWKFDDVISDLVGADHTLRLALTRAFGAEPLKLWTQLRMEDHELRRAALPQPRASE